jgi:hypothetical protein
MDFERFENSFWVCFITMTTVGYGDLYARTIIGRMITIVVACGGIFIVSIMVVVLTNMVALETAE